MGYATIMTNDKTIGVQFFAWGTTPDGHLPKPTPEKMDEWKRDNPLSDDGGAK